ncbi:MAG: type II secretion system F family protein [Planctomycetales bacterium]|nr:type II secretion system F family protein [Planctomycetales bacterium]MCA9166870.1 type II secretion system F family protein [Planctomycetales bacterium]
MSLTLIICLAGGIAVAALVGGVTMLFRSSADNVAEDRLGMLTGKGNARKRAEKEATVISKPLDDVPNAIEEMVSRFTDLSLLLEQANVAMPPSQFVMISGGLLAVGTIIPVIAGLPFWSAPLIGLTLGSLPLMLVVMKRRGRKNKFAKQLPEALELISRALRAGHSLGSGFHLVSTEMVDPIACEFGRCYEEQNLGIPMEEALDSLANRVPNLDLRFFATAVILQRQTGGDLAEILDKIGNLVRERFKIWGQIQALTGEGRLSGIVLLALPPVLFVVMLKLNYEYTMTLFEDPMGKQMLVGAIISQLVGALVIRKIVNIKV